MLELRQRWLVAAATIALSAIVDCKGETGIDNSTTPTTTQGEITIHTISVGSKENAFSPNSINALPGDIVTFQFWPGNHSVIRAEYGFPCIPYEDIYTSSPGFYSGIMPVNDSQVPDNPPSWNLTINDTSPVFFYCGAPGSCVGYGMVGAINANAQTSLVTQIELAKEANYVLLPGQALPGAASSSMQSMASSAMTVTVTAQSTTTSSATVASATSGSDDDNDGSHNHNHKSSLSGGAIAGIVIGGIAILLLAAGLFYFFGRSKTLSEQIQQSKTPVSAIPPSDSFLSGARDAGSRHASNLPPYAPYAAGSGVHEAKTPMEADGTEVYSRGLASPPCASPEMRQREAFSGSRRPGSSRFSESPGLGTLNTSREPSAEPQELYAPTGLSPQQAGRPPQGFI